MPAYQFHRLSLAGGDPAPLVEMFYADDAAMRWVMDRVTDGCDVWQGQRFVGRVHGPATTSARPEASEAALG